jgi:hypothetical protein
MRLASTIWPMSQDPGFNRRQLLDTAIKVAGTASAAIVAVPPIE